MIYERRIKHIEYVGYWVLPGANEEARTKIKFTSYNKPRWRHRFFMQFLMGWKWEDA